MGIDEGDAMEYLTAMMNGNQMEMMLGKQFFSEGMYVGDKDCVDIGTTDGDEVGCTDADDVGVLDGVEGGKNVGDKVGRNDGVVEGSEVGSTLGEDVGFTDGFDEVLDVMKQKGRT